MVLVTTILCGCAASGPLRVATDAVFPPFHYVDDGGSLAGFDVELAREAGRRIGREVEVERAPSYAALFEGLLDGRYDVVAATTGITEQRQRRYGFSRPYFRTCLAVLVRAGPGEPARPADLAGRAVAASAGTTSAAAAHAIDGATVVETGRWRDSLAALRAGEVDAVIIDEFEAVPFARDAGDLEVLAEPIASEWYGLVVRLDETALRIRLGEAIDAMAADGTLAALRERYGLDRPAGWPVQVPP